MSHFDNFSEFLASTLHAGTQLRAYHVSTSPTSCAPIFAASPRHEGEPTTCESHFLAVSQLHVTAPETNGSHKVNVKSSDEELNEVLVLGIEILIFDSRNLTTVFVSKADSTGFLNRPATQTLDAKIQQGSPSIIKAVTFAFLKWLVSQSLRSRTSDPVLTTGDTRQASQHLHGDIDPQSIRYNGNSRTHNGKVQHENGSESVKPALGKRLVLSLFARSQNQYLFPGSVENETKHVLDDRELIKWWCRVLDGLVQYNWPISGLNRPFAGPVPGTIDFELRTDRHQNGTTQKSNDANIAPEAFVIVPGCDRSETIRSFFPASTRFKPAGTKLRWHNSYPAGLLDRVVSEAQSVLPVRCLVPRLPDDPKARYCDDLDSSGIDEAGQWREIKTLDQFWDMMSYRQECSAGRLVGFVWVVFDPPAQDDDVSNGQADTAPTTAITQFAGHQPSVRGQDSRLTASELIGSHAITTINTSKVTAVPNPAQPIPPVQLAQEILDPGSVKLTSENYNTLADYLIDTTDFAGIKIALKSTQGWIAKVKELAGVSSFGVTVKGRLAPPALQDTGNSESNDSTAAGMLSGLKHARSERRDIPVNVLVGVRKKKRKVEGDAGGNDQGSRSETSHADAFTKEQSSTAVQRKKTNGVQGLPAGLVRKKPKPDAA